jgi:hypothetical protein
MDAEVEGKANNGFPLAILLYIFIGALMDTSRCGALISQTSLEVI